MKDHLEEKNELWEEIFLITKDNSEKVAQVKIGTGPSSVIWVREEDMPLEVGTNFRYTEKDPSDHPTWGYTAEFGVVDKIRDIGGDMKLYFIGVDGYPWNIEDVDWKRWKEYGD